jgi:hypothetical protein
MDNQIDLLQKKLDRIDNLDLYRGHEKAEGEG